MPLKPVTTFSSWLCLWFHLSLASYFHRTRTCDNLHLLDFIRRNHFHRVRNTACCERWRFIVDENFLHSVFPAASHSHPDQPAPWELSWVHPLHFLLWEVMSFSALYTSLSIFVSMSDFFFRSLFFQQSRSWYKHDFRTLIVGCFSLMSKESTILVPYPINVTAKDRFRFQIFNFKIALPVSNHTVDWTFTSLFKQSDAGKFNRFSCDWIPDKRSGYFSIKNPGSPPAKLPEPPVGSWA